MRDTLHFRLGAEDREFHGIDPTMTVLEYLRGPERLRGTKEGCAEGDCGACTVVLVDQAGRCQAVNACILFLPALDGKQLLTVEHLAPDGKPHPVQQAMVDHHGSQCGFCTPGFVMSIVALQTEATADRTAVNEALAGNLCRCTGYRPIVDAALAVCAGNAPSSPAQPVSPPDTALTLARNGTRCLAPRSINELARTLETYPEAVIVAGGTDVGLWVTKQRRKLPLTVSLDAVAGLAAINETPQAIQIGARAPYKDARAALGKQLPDFGARLPRIGSRQIRNRGTIGGNLATASPIGDTPPVLLALGATLVLRKGSQQRAVALEDFFTGYRKTVLAPGEFIERIDVPLPHPGDEFRCYKVAKRFDQDISAVSAAFRLRLDQGVVRDIRIGFGGMAATPLRLRALEDALTGRPWTEPTIRMAQPVLDASMAPLSDWRASAAYRRTVARNLLLKFFLETNKEAAVTRLVPA